MRTAVLVAVALLALEAPAAAQVPVGLSCQCPTAQGGCFQCYDRSNPDVLADDGICSPSGTCCAPSIGPQSQRSGCLPGQCGDVDDGCGLTVSCGDTCGTGQVCNAGSCCTPLTCAAYAAGGQCGSLSNGCGGSLACEPIPGTVCEGTAITACTHSTCPATAQCGQIPDGNCFDSFLDCGTCPSGLVCAGEVCENPAPAMPASVTALFGSLLAIVGFAFTRSRLRRS